jgi:hypothetical protein
VLFCPLDPDRGSGMEKNPDHVSVSSVIMFGVILLIFFCKFSVADPALFKPLDPGSGMENTDLR